MSELVRASINFGIRATFLLGIKTCLHILTHSPNTICLNSNLAMSAIMSLKEKLKAMLMNNKAVSASNRELKDSNQELKNQREYLRHQLGRTDEAKEENVC